MSSESVPSLQAALLQSNLTANERIILRATVVKIGRSVNAPHDIPIRADDVQSSREHATLTLDNGQWYLEDTSRNGTVVGGKVINRTRVPVHGNDRIQIGTSFDYTFKLIVETSQSIADSAPRSYASFAPPAAPAAPPAEPQPPRQNGIWISPSAAIWRDGQRLAISLSRTEYRLLKYLSHHVGDVCEYDEVINAVWGGMRDKDSLHELIYRVRRKVEPNPSAPKYLIIRSGIGVVFFPNGVNTQKD
jgi:Transcriptional regulatory protein, C terminal/FHA domain